jgi:aspartyl-tRNA(Asn)/glutamyl-tRNA(Gln) amidotransferase subunit C
MKITRQEVEHIAHLARLEFSGEEVESFTEQLNDILSYFDKLSEVDTDSVEPTSHAIRIANVFREDEVVESAPQEAGLANAPDQEKGLFRVPKIIE